MSKLVENEVVFEGNLSVAGMNLCVGESKNKKVKTPKQGELVKTCPELCMLCMYNKVMSNKWCVCDYFLMTGKVRGCKVGECDKFEKIEGKRRLKMPG